MRVTDRVLLRVLQESAEEAQIIATGNIGKEEVSESAGGQAGMLEGVLLYEPGCMPEAGWGYVASAEVFATAAEQGVTFPEPVLLVICQERENRTAVSKALRRLKKQYPYLCFAGTVMSALNQLMRAFHHVADWERRLGQIQHELGTAEEMLQESLDLFGNPLVILREDLSEYAEASTAPLPARYHLWGSGKEQLDLMNAVLQDGAFAQNRSRQEAFWGPDYITGVRSLGWIIRKEGCADYILCVLEYERTLEEADKDLLQLLGYYLRPLLHGSEGRDTYRERRLHRMLASVLTGGVLDYEKVHADFHEAGWLREHSYLCLVMQAAYLDRRKAPDTMICRHVEQQYAGCCSFPYQEKIVTVFDLDLCGREVEEIAAGLTPLIRDSFLKAGYSRIAQSHQFLRQQYVQANAALELGCRKRPHIWIHHFDQVALDYLLEQMTGEVSVNLLCHPGLLKLDTYDRENGTQYIQTLQVYLKQNQNAVHSAKELFIHRSTFLYRMDKIKEITGDIFENPREVLYLNLSFALLEREREG